MFKLRHVLEFIFDSDMPFTSGEYLTSVMNSSIKCLFFAKLLVLKWTINVELFCFLMTLLIFLREKYSS